MDRHILVTNDDGIGSPALDVLEKALKRLGQPTIVVPDREMSATSHSITLNRPLRFQQLARNRFAVDGTPADCVILSCLRILPEPPELLVSGINRGKNVGDSILYSGTLAAAFEGALQEIPSIAVSVEYSEDIDYQSAADFTAVLAHKVLQEGVPPGVVLNLNFPAEWNGSVIQTRQGEKAGKAVLVENLDPRGQAYYWLHEELHQHGSNMVEELPADSDALADGYGSLTPLQLDRTAFRYVKGFSTWTDVLDDVSDTIKKQP